MKEIIKIIKSNNVDVFCFQEVTSTLINFLLEDEDFFQNLYISGTVSRAGMFDKLKECMN